MSMTFFLLGTLVGSFLNVCIYRIPRKQSVVWGGSRCPACKRLLLWRHKIPLLSYLFLNGECAWCKKCIPGQYPLVEYGTGVVFAMVYQKHLLDPQLPTLLTLASILIVVAMIDFAWFRIPNTVLLFGLGLWLSSVLALPIDVLRACLGALVGSGLLLLVGGFGMLLFKKSSVGAGDVKLAGLIGLFLGPEGCLVVLAAAIIVGGLVGSVGLISGHLRGDSRLPFGTFLTIITILQLYFEVGIDQVRVLFL